MSIVNAILKGIFGDKSEKDIKEITPLLEKIKEAYGTLQGLTNDELRGHTANLRKIISDRTAPIEAQIAELKLRMEDDSIDIHGNDLVREKLLQLTEKKAIIWWAITM